MAERNWIKSIYWGFVKGENFLGNFLLLLIRIYWGGLLIVTGMGKWANIEGVSDYFASLNIPAPVFMAYFVGTLEFLGGVSLFLGLFARIFSLILVALLFVAYATAHQEALVNFFVNPSLFIDESPFLYLYASLIVLCFGSGFISIDYWWEKRAYGEKL